MLFRSQIYWGAVPFVIIQCIMVGLVIGFPQMVMHYKSAAPDIDTSKIEIKIPTFGGGSGLPGIPGGLGSPFGPPPSFGSPPPGLTAPPGTPAMPPATTPPPVAPEPQPQAATTPPPAAVPAEPAAAPAQAAVPPMNSGMIDVTKPPLSLQDLAPKAN